MEKTVKLYSLSASEKKSYLLAAIFIVGNVVLPQLCHLIPSGGMILLPIYFFTLIAAYKYGITVGLVTALCSPLINSLLFGMPAAAALPVIMVKSTLLAVAASLVAHRVGKISFWGVLFAVVAYQLVGGLFEWAYVGQFSAAVQDWTLGLPGMVLQVIGGYWCLRAIARF